MIMIHLAPVKPLSLSSFYVCLKHKQGVFQTPAISSVGVGYDDALADKRSAKVRSVNFNFEKVSIYAMLISFDIALSETSSSSILFERDKEQMFKTSVQLDVEMCYARDIP